MRKWMFTCAVVSLVGLCAELASAQELIQAPTTEIVSPAPRGLFRRARERRQVVVVAQPVSNTTAAAPVSPIQQAQAIEAPKVVTTPMVTTMTQPQEVVEVRRGLFGRGRRQVMVVNQPMVVTTPVAPTTPPSPIQQAEGTEASKSLTPPMTTPMIQPQAIEVRRGLFGRMRSR